MRNSIKSGLEKIFTLRIVFMNNSKVHEFVEELKDGIELKYLETLYQDLNRMVRDMKYQLLIVIPLERMKDDRIPIFITQDFDECTVFSVEKYLNSWGLDAVKRGGVVRRAKNRV